MSDKVAYLQSIGNNPGDLNRLDVTGQSKADSIGTFNKFAVSGMGLGGGPGIETAANTREMRRILKRFEIQGITTTIPATA